MIGVQISPNMEDRSILNNVDVEVNQQVDGGSNNRNRKTCAQPIMSSPSRLSTNLPLDKYV